MRAMVEKHSAAEKRPSAGLLGSGDAGSSRTITLVILVVLVLGLAIAFYQVMIGFLLPLFLATLLTILFQPLHERIQRACHHHDRVAAGLTTLAILLIVLAPIGYVLFRAAAEAFALLLQPGGPQFDRATLDRLVTEINQHFGLDLSASELIKTVVSNVQDVFGPLAAKTPGVIGSWLISGLVTVFALYYFLADGHELTDSAIQLIPLDPKYQRTLISKFVELSRAVTSASLLVAVTQGVLIGAGYYFAGVHGLFLLIMLTMLASFIPLIGSALVWGSCSVWLYFGHEPTPAVMLLAWSLVVVLFTDNLLKPLVLHGQAKLHPLLALLSVLGGVQMLGPLGIFVGPMVVAFLQTGLKMLNSELQLLRRKPAKS
jgi:predicted PurR-regulated permease PerM